MNLEPREYKVYSHYEVDNCVKQVPTTVRRVQCARGLNLDRASQLENTGVGVGPARGNRRHRVYHPVATSFLPYAVTRPFTLIARQPTAEYISILLAIE